MWEGDGGKGERSSTKEGISHLRYLLLLHQHRFPRCDRSSAFLGAQYVGPKGVSCTLQATPLVEWSLVYGPPSSRRGL